MADPGMPAKGGENLGNYHDFGYELFIYNCTNIIQRWAMRNFYNETDEPLPESFDSCPGKPSDYLN
jgi:hypothetical protein